MWVVYDESVPRCGARQIHSCCLLAEQADIPYMNRYASNTRAFSTPRNAHQMHRPCPGAHHNHRALHRLACGCFQPACLPHYCLRMLHQQRVLDWRNNLVATHPQSARRGLTGCAPPLPTPTRKFRKSIVVAPVAVGQQRRRQEVQ
jgi:hypothetical protein